MSDSFEHKLDSADPSTMPRVVDGKNMAAGMMESLSSRIGGVIVTEIFPVTVVSLDGDQVVLSQGGGSLQVGQRWRAVALGQELKDPQTGRSLGRNETPVGVVRIDRVSGKTSYGTFEDGAPNLTGQAFKAGNIELRQMAQAKTEKVAMADKVAVTQATAPVPAKPAARARKGEAEIEVGAPKERAAGKEDDKSW